MEKKIIKQGVFSINDDQKIYFNYNFRGDYDWNYEDEDRVFSLYAEIGDDSTRSISKFVDYCKGKCNLTNDESDILLYLICTNWVKHYIKTHEIDDEDDDVLKFLLKYDFKITSFDLNREPDDDKYMFN